MSAKGAGRSEENGSERRAECRRRLADRIRKEGTNSVQKRLDVTTSSLLSYAGDFPLYRATAERIERRFIEEYGAIEGISA